MNTFCAVYFYYFLLERAFKLAKKIISVICVNERKNLIHCLHYLSLDFPVFLVT